MSATVATQKAIRARLLDTSAVTDLVSATSILDRNQRPAPSPSIILGEVQLVDEGRDIARRQTRVFHTLHVWKKEPSLAGVNAIAGAAQQAMQSQRLQLDTGFHCIDSKVSGIRAMRDPDGETSHAVLTIEILALESS